MSDASPNSPEPVCEPAFPPTNPFDIKGYSFWWFTWFYGIRLSSRVPGFIQTGFLLLLLAVVLYTIGLVIAWLSSFTALYVSLSKSWPILLGIGGICYFTGIVGILLPAYAHRIETLQPLFSIPREAYGALFRKWANRVCDNRRNAAWSTALSLVIIGLGDTLWLQHGSSPGSRLAAAVSGLVDFMPDVEWYDHPLAPKLAILNMLGLFVCSYIAVSLRAILHHIGLMREIGRLRLASLYLPPLAILKFRELTNFNFFLSCNYSIGIILFVIMSDLQSPIVVGALVVMSLFSFAIVLVPYWFLVQRLRLETEELIDYLTKSYVRRSVDPEVGEHGEGIRGLIDMIDMAARLPTGMYELQLGLGNVVATAAVSIAVSYFKLEQGGP